MILGGAVGEDGIAGGALGIGRLHDYFHPIRDGLAHPSNTLDPTQPLVTAHSYRLFRDPCLPDGAQRSYRFAGVWMIIVLGRYHECLTRCACRGRSRQG